MADKAQALYSFWASFGLPAYDQYAVPDEATMTAMGAPPYPRITYEDAESDFDRPIALTASIWYRSPSWAEISQKANQIFQYIGKGGVLLGYDGGALWIKRGSPFSRRMDDPEDDMIRRVFINIEAESLS